MSICPAAGQDFQNTPCPAALVFSLFGVDTDKKKQIFLCYVCSGHQDVAKYSRLRFKNRRLPDMEYFENLVRLPDIQTQLCVLPRVLLLLYYTFESLT